MDPVERLLRERYCPETLPTTEAAPKAASVVSKAVDVPKIQLVMSAEEFTAEEIFKACGEFNKANAALMNRSFTLLTDFTLPTGHVLKAGSWVFRLNGL